MKTPSPAILFSAFAVSLCFISCSAVTNAGKSSVSLVQRTSAATTAKISELSDASLAKIRPAGVKVVEVREKDLKELPTGQERALAFESTRKRGFWIFEGPMDLKLPALPQAGAELDGSLLPPKGP
jgi:hypothetical protein